MPTPRNPRKTGIEMRAVTLLPNTNDAVIAQFVRTQSSSGRWRPSTVRLRALQLKVIARELGPTPLTEVTEEQVLDWYEKLSGKPETRASYASAVHGLFRWMTVYARPRLRIDDPSLILQRPRIPAAQARPMLDRHYDLALACAVSDPEMYLWLGLMGCCGFRCCEIAWMQTSDIEELPSGAGFAHIEGKGGKRRTVPIGAMLMATIAPFLKARGPVFTRPSDGRAHTPNMVSAKVSRFLQEVGVPAPARAHSIRHRFGTDYHVIDVDVFRQAQLMGHSSIDMTRRYTEIHPLEAADHIEKLTRWRLRPGRRPDLRQLDVG